MECDFSGLSKYGDHTLRVRAEFEDEHSDWVNITFCPVDDSKSLRFPFHCNVIIMPCVLPHWFFRQPQFFECPPSGWPCAGASGIYNKGDCGLKEVHERDGKGEGIKSIRQLNVNVNLITVMS